MLFPLPFPELVVDPGVFVPTQGSFLVWKHLFESGVGEGESCLDVGCGCGILAMQLALNGASAVHAIDIDRNAVANTLSNAFRNGVADRVTGDTADLFDWEPERSFDVVVASLYQLPVDPFDEPTGSSASRLLGPHAPRPLPAAPPQAARAGREGVRDAALDHRAARDRAPSRSRRASTPGSSSSASSRSARSSSESKAQIERVEQLSDAYHIEIGDEDVMVAYLLEVTHPGA